MIADQINCGIERGRSQVGEKEKKVIESMKVERQREKKKNFGNGGKERLNKRHEGLGNREQTEGEHEKKRERGCHRPWPKLSPAVERVARIGSTHKK